MEMHIYNATKDELSKNKFMTFVGISVGIKPMTPELAFSYLQWAEEHSSDVVQILIADEIVKYNYLAYSHYTKPGCLNRAIRDGDKYHLFFEKIIDKFPVEKRNRFNIIRWQDIQSPEYCAMLQEVEREFATNKAFRDEIFSILQMYIARRGRNISQERKMILCHYLLEELPTLLDGIHVNCKNYSLILYPTYRTAGFSQLVSDIQNKRRYVNLSERLDLKRTIRLVEAIIN